MAISNRLLFLILVLLLPAYVFAQAPVANFTATPTSGCIPLPVQFNATSSTGSPTSYSWSIPGAGTIPTTNATPSVVFTTPGTKTVTLTVSNASGSSSKTLTIQVYDTPSVSFTATPLSGCAPLNVQFTNTSNSRGTGASTYSWAMGDGSPFNSNENPSHTYTASGCKNVTLKLTNNFGCMKSITKNSYVCVNSVPQVSFTASVNTFCRVGGTTTFTSTIASGTGTAPFSYDWDYGDGSPHGTTANPSHTYTGTAPSSYTVILKVTDANGCQTTVTQNAFVVVKDVTANFTATSGVCIGSAISVTNTSTPSFTGSYWDFSGLGNSYTSPTTTFTYPNPGTYTITLIASEGPCKDTTTKTVTIFPQPTLDFSSPTTVPCPAPVNIGLTATGTSTSYRWDYGDNSATGTGNPVSHTYANNGIYTVTLVGTDANGCKDTVTKIDYIKVLDMEAVIAPLKTGGCIPFTTTFTAGLFTHIPPPGPHTYPYGIASYDWDFGDNSAHSTAATPTHTYTTAGKFNVILTGYSANGCPFKDTFVIETGTPPVANFTMPAQACVHQLVNLTGTSTGTVTAHNWDFGDKQTSGLGPTTSHEWDTNGTFTVTYIPSYNSCPDTIQKTINIVGSRAKLASKVICATPTKVEFTVRPTGHTSMVLYFGDGNSDNTMRAYNDVVTHTYATLGTYNAMLVTFDNVTGCSDTAIQQVKLIDPKVQIAVADTTICKGQTLRFTGSLSGNEPTLSMEWYIQNAYQADSMPNFSYTFNATGYYTIKLIVQDMLGCRDTLTKANWIQVSKPDVAFTATPANGCVILNTSFNDQSTFTTGTSRASRTWDFFNNGGRVTTTTNPYAATYPTAGTFDVKLIVTDNNGCSDSLLKDDYISVWKPVASFRAKKRDGCIGFPVEFECLTADAQNVNWDFGDGKTGSGVNNNHNYAATGKYTVTMIVTDSHGCKDTLTRTDYITITKPDANFSLSDTFSVCPPLQVIANSSATTGAGNLSFYWDMGNGNTSLFANPNDVYSSGFYTLTLIVTDSAGCKDTAKQSVNVLGYAGSFNYTTLSGCAPLDVTFNTSLSRVPSIVWDFSDGTTQVTGGVANITHTYIIPGSYLPRIVLTDGLGCSNSSEGKDTIKVDGVTGDFTYTPACIGEEITFTDKSVGYFSPVNQWTWKFHDGTTDNFDEVTKTYPNTGTYPVKLYLVNNNGCKDTVEKDVVVHDLPVITTVPDTIICLGDAAQLMGYGGVSYIWSPANGLSCSACTDPLASPTAATGYVVEGTDVNGCSNTDTVMVSIKTKTDSDVDTGGTICDGMAFQLRAYGAQRYEWWPGETLSDKYAAEPLAYPSTTTTYIVAAYEGSCIPDTNSVKVFVNPRPKVRASGAATIISGGNTQLLASGELIDKFLWAPGGSLSCIDCSNPIASPTRTTEYNVTASTDKGCQDSDKVVVTVLCDQSQLFIPNTFTPNGDGHNDVFYPRGVGLDLVKSIRVYNRWGEVVYERNSFNLNDKTSGWDGTFKGQALPPDVFVYVIDAVCEDGKPIQWKGDVSLVR